ncbi:MAG: F0F1 ATP synthase subunit B [bacterium]|nr:F0F1 ATP synthase subunit B [bacterium]MCP4799717.1 F0F1 ATP synthase subunit B [bacterium]
MNIDFSVVLTTIIGFLIVVAILKKFAWEPILSLLDERRETIRKDFADAESARTDAEEIKQDFELKIGEIKVIERERIQEAAKAGENLATRIKSEAQDKAEATLSKARTDIEVEAQKAQVELRDSVVDLAIGAAEKLLNEKLDDETHRRLISEYIDNLGETPNA